MKGMTNLMKNPLMAWNRAGSMRVLAARSCSKTVVTVAVSPVSRKEETIRMTTMMSSPNSLILLTKNTRLMSMKNMSLMNWTIFLKTRMPMNRNTPRPNRPRWPMRAVSSLAWRKKIGAICWKNSGEKGYTFCRALSAPSLKPEKRYEKKISRKKDEKME